MQQAANTGHFNPLVPKAHNSEARNRQFPLQISKPVKVSQSLQIFYFCSPSSALIGLIKKRLGRLNRQQSLKL